MRALGIDPGTGTFDLAVVDGERVVYEDSLPAAEVAEDPERLIRAIEASRADVIAAPSGYGVPFTWASDVRDPLRFTYEVLLLSTREQIAKASGELGVKVYEALALVVSQLVKADVRAVFVPSVILLRTVPAYRKYNKVDMGTADKLASALIAVHGLARRKGVRPSEVSAVVLELGFGYNSAISVLRGRVVDGIGGTYASFGPLTAGSLDLEVVVGAPSWSRFDVYKGGLAEVCGTYDLREAERRYEAGEEPCASAYRAWLEGVLKDVARASVPIGREAGTVVLNGRYSGLRSLREALREAMPDVEVVEGSRLPGSSVTKEASQGYAAMAAHAAGGGEGLLEEVMRVADIDSACGTVADYIVHPAAVPLRERVRRAYVESVARPKLCL